jgi:hypothetical protein
MMRFFRWYWNLMVSAFTTDPHERTAAALVKSNARFERMGFVQLCRECRQPFAKNKTICDTCECPTDPTAPRRVVLNKVYRGRNPSDSFKKEADILATCGWYSVTQAAGGTRGYQTFDVNKQAGEIIVTYKRD